jgi:RimJ/RimL family protein N-acetyltransferase
MNDVIIRALAPSEWEAFRDFRLDSLKAAPGVFAMTFDEAAIWSPEDWQAETQGPDHQVFGLFDDSRLIGITAVFTYRGDPTGRTALLAMSFILPPYRGRGLSRHFYDARLAYIRAQPRFRRVLVSHRESNEVSRRANQQHGFVRTASAPHTWPDGETENEIFYELELSDHSGSAKT